MQMQCIAFLINVQAANLNTVFNNYSPDRKKIRAKAESQMNS